MGFFMYRRGPGDRRGRWSGGFMPGCLLWSIGLSIFLTIVLNLIIRLF
jgi:hypothetical protein